MRVLFCDDSDLLRWELSVAIESSFASAWRLQMELDTPRSQGNRDMLTKFSSSLSSRCLRVTLHLMFVQCIDCPCRASVRCLLSIASYWISKSFCGAHFGEDSVSDVPTRLLLAGSQTLQERISKGRNVQAAVVSADCSVVLLQGITADSFLACCQACKGRCKAGIGRDRKIGTREGCHDNEWWHVFAAELIIFPCCDWSYSLYRFPR